MTTLLLTRAYFWCFKGSLDLDIVLYLQVYCSSFIQIELDLFLVMSYPPLPLSSSGPTLISCLFDYVVVQLVKELRTTDASMIYVGVQHTRYA